MNIVSREHGKLVINTPVLDQSRFDGKPTPTEFNIKAIIEDNTVTILISVLSKFTKEDKLLFSAEAESTILIERENGDMWSMGLIFSFIEVAGVKFKEQLEKDRHSLSSDCAQAYKFNITQELIKQVADILRPLS